MNKNDWMKIARAFGLLTMLGIVMISNIAVALWLGNLLDKLTGRVILFKLIAIVIGVFSGFYSDYRLINDILGDNNEDR